MFLKRFYLFFILKGKMCFCHTYIEKKTFIHLSIYSFSYSFIHSLIQLLLQSTIIIPAIFIMNDLTRLKRQQLIRHYNFCCSCLLFVLQVCFSKKKKKKNVSQKTLFLHILQANNQELNTKNRVHKFVEFKRFFLRAESDMRKANIILRENTETLKKAQSTAVVLLLQST